MTEPTIVRDAAGKILSYRYTDGTGWNKTYDDKGNTLACRHTDGTGYDCTYDESGNRVTCRLTNGTGWDATYDASGNELTCTKITPKEKTMNNENVQRLLGEIYEMSEFIKEAAEKAQDYTRKKPQMVLMIQPMKEGMMLLKKHIEQLDTHVNELDQ